MPLEFSGLGLVPKEQMSLNLSGKSINDCEQSGERSSDPPTGITDIFLMSGKLSGFMTDETRGASSSCDSSFTCVLSVRGVNNETYCNCGSRCNGRYNGLCS